MLMVLWYYMRMKKTPKTKSLKNRIITGLATLSVITGVGVHSTFDSPSEILMSDVKEPTPIVREFEPEKPQQQEAAIPQPSAQETEQSGFKAWLMRLPIAVRGAVVVPLYAIGAVITHILGLFFGGVMAPVLASILKWVVLTAAILGVVAVVLKLIFPNLPLKKLLRPKNILYVFIGVAVIQILDKTLPLAFPNYESFANALKYTLGLCVAIIAIVPIATSKLRQRTEA